MVDRLPDVFAIPSEVETTSVFSLSRGLAAHSQRAHASGQVAHHASPPSIQGAMASPAWSIFVRPPQLFVAPPPRSYVFTLLNEDHSPVWRRWAECSGFHINMLETESVPLLRRHHTLTRESRANRRSPRAFLSAPPTTKAKADGAPLR